MSYPVRFAVVFCNFVTFGQTPTGRSQGLRGTLKFMSSRHTPTSCLRAFTLAACALLATGVASAQWLWIDSAGNKVFSDTAPPPGTPEKNILRTPAG